MPDSPSSWPVWVELIKSWWRGENPLGAVLMSVLVAGLRQHYERREASRAKKITEVLLCGLITLAISSTLEFFGLPQSLCVAVGGGVGLVGVDAIRGFFVNKLKKDESRNGYE